MNLFKEGSIKMAQKRRRRRRKQMKITQWFKKLSTKQKVLLISGIVLLLIMLAGVIYVASIFGKLDTQEIKEEDIFINEELENVGVGYTNFVLFGGDSRSGDVTKNLNTDTIIIVSLNNATKEVKMVSVYRDTLLDLTNGKIKKCNSAYSNGGAKQAINMLNMNLDLDIKKYVTVDFSAVVDLVDMVGGIEVEVSKAEMKEMNKFIGETASVANKKANYISKTGLQTLDGVQATTYARIRKNVGNDFARTERQRLVIQKVVEKAMKSDLSTINKIIDELFPRISTNFTMTEILSYAKDFKKYKFGETSGFPFVKGSGTIPGRGSSVFPITLESNVSELHKFLYGTEDYQPSSKVVEISGEIAYIVRDRKPDSDSSNTSDNTDTSDDPTTENPTDDPDNPTVDPENPTDDPENPTDTPENPTDTPENPTDTPENPTDTPENPTDTPENPTDTPENPTDTPENPTDTPENPTETPETPIEGPEDTDSGSETVTP